MQYWQSMGIFINNSIIIYNEFSIWVALWVWVTQNIWEKKAWKWEAVGERGHEGGGVDRVGVGTSSALISDNGLEPYQLEQESVTKVTKETEFL